MKKVVVDTTVWSLFMRRRRKKGEVIPAHVAHLRRLIAESRAQMLGIVRQELLSGISDLDLFKKIEKSLTAYPDLVATSADHLLAAKFYNTCRRNGIQGSHIDFLICAQAFRCKMSILSRDGDFDSYAKYIPIEIEAV